MPITYSTIRSCTGFEPDARQRGFSLVEALVSLLITLIVLGMVFRTAQMLVAIYRTESETAEKSAAAIRAFDDIAVEIARAGYGLGDGVQAVLPFVVGGSGAPGEITIRSNAAGLAANLEGELVSAGEAVTVSHAELFQEGDKAREPPGNGAEGVQVLGDQENRRRQKAIEGYKLGGLITTAAGVGLGIFLYFETPDSPTYLVGLIPLMVGLVLILYGFVLAPRSAPGRE